MALASVMERPKRWHVPFSEDPSRVGGPRPMTDQDVKRLLHIAPFNRMSKTAFPKAIPLRGILKNDTSLQRYADGQLVVRQGDYGNSAFLIVQGRVRVILEPLDPASLGRLKPHKKTWLQSIKDLVLNPTSPEVRDPQQYPQHEKHGSQPSAPGAQSLREPITNVLAGRPDLFATTENLLMQEGQMFGELAALGRIPRAATVVADGAVELLEVRWQGLRDLRKFDEALRSHTDQQYREFGLANTLDTSPLLAHLDKAAVDRIAEAAEFETFGRFDWHGTYKQLRDKQNADPLTHEPVIAEEGHYPNGLILIRAGFARLSTTYGDGERTYSYLGKGDVYGVAELAHNARSSTNQPLLSTLRAVGYVDIVRIPTPTFESLILPTITPALLAEHSHVPSFKRRDATLIDPAQTEFLVENRFINGTATMLIDLDRCVRCDDCVRACASGHSNNPRFVRHGRTFDHYMVANACMHCIDPVCMIGCPTGAIHRTAEGGQVVINDRTCIGCQVCADSCPYDNIRMVEVRDQTRNDAIMVGPDSNPIVKATKCDLCIDHSGGPACERACPHDALRRVDMRDVGSLAQWLDR